MRTASYSHLFLTMSPILSLPIVIRAVNTLQCQVKWQVDSMVRGSQSRNNMPVSIRNILKKMTCLLTIREWVMVCTQLMSRLSPCSASTLSPTSQIISLCGVLLHQKVKG
jgi:hypothetical protein